VGFARLTFNETATNAEVMADVVRVVTGSSPVNAIQGSEVVNIKGTNWSLLYSSDNDTISDTAHSYILSAPCVTAGKTKYARLSCASVTTDSVSLATSGSVGDIVDEVSATRFGFVLQGLSGASSIDTFSNVSQLITASTGLQHYWYVLKLTPVYKDITISWSNRHLFIHSQTARRQSTSQTGNVLAVQSVMEYPETTLTLGFGVVPVSFMSVVSKVGGSTANTFPFIVPASASDVPAELITAGRPPMWLQNQIGVDTSGPITNQNLAANTAIQLTGPTTTGILGHGTAMLTHRIIVPTFDLNNDPQYNFIPLFWSMPTQGIPTFDWSTLTDIFVTGENHTALGSDIPVGADTYVYLPLAIEPSSSIQSGAYVVKKQ